MVVARAVLTVAMGCLAVQGCGVPDAPLAVPVSCQAVLSMEMGDDIQELLPRLGQPYRGGHLNSANRIEGSDYDEMWSYGSIAPDMGFGFWDHYDIYVFKGRVISAWARRHYGNTGNSPDGNNPRLAFSLSRGPDGSVVREIGPAFNDVFGCDPPVMIPV